MNSLLERSARFLKTNMDKGHVSVEIEYHRGVAAIEALKAIAGRTEFEQYTLEDAVGTSKQFDWVVSEQDLWLDGVKVQPEPGDFVVYQLADGRRFFYLVVSQDGRRSFDVADQFGVLYRIHTKLDRIELNAV